MAPTPIRQLARHVDYDAARRRLWIAGQRCHHGATGTLLATTGVVVLGARVARRGAFAIAAAYSGDRAAAACAVSSHSSNIFS